MTDKERLNFLYEGFEAIAILTSNGSPQGSPVIWSLADFYLQSKDYYERNAS